VISEVVLKIDFVFVLRANCWTCCSAWTAERVNQTVWQIGEWFESAAECWPGQKSSVISVLRQLYLDLFTFQIQNYSIAITACTIISPL